MSNKMRKTRIGVISASGIAQAHMQAVRLNSGAELVAICDIDVAKAEAAANRFALSRENVYTDYREMLRDEELDAVVIATPDQIHEEQTVTALEAGLHVLCEKPMALTLPECRSMIAAADRTGRQLMIGQIGRYTPGFVLTHDLIAQGEIGELFFVESEYAHDYAHITGANNWRLDPVRLRHGVIGGGCHAIDLLRWIAGNPTEVFAYANRKMLRSWPVDDTTIAVLKFPDDIIGKVFVSTGCKRNYTMRSVFYGSKGTIIADNTTPSISIFREHLNPETAPEHDDQAIEAKIPVSLANHNAVAEVADFVSALRAGRPVTTDGREGARTVAAAVAIIASAASGCPEAVEEIV